MGGVVKKLATQSDAMSSLYVVDAWQERIISMSLMVIWAIHGCMFSLAGSFSGKYAMMGASYESFPSSASSPTAMEVKLLLMENMRCRLSAVQGA